MNRQFFAVCLSLLALSACVSLPKSSQQATLPSARTTGSFAEFQLPESTSSTHDGVGELARYETMLRIAKQGTDDVQLEIFLADVGNSAMGEAVRNEWLKTLAKQGNIQKFQQEYAKLDTAGVSQENRCHHARFTGSRQLAEQLVQETGNLPAACNQLIEQNAPYLSAKQVWRRVRGLMSIDQITNAQNLAIALGSPLNQSTGIGAQENLLRQIIGKNEQKQAASAVKLQELQNTGAINAEQAGFAWAVLARQQALAHNFTTALDYFQRADKQQLDKEQFEWYARSALRLQQWQTLADIIQSMPEKQGNEPTWQYWLARSLTALGQPQSAKALYQQAAKSGRNFYAVLSQEELGETINVNNNWQSNAHTQQDEEQRIRGHHNIARSLALFQHSVAQNDFIVRRAAQNEWRYATRQMNERTKLAAARVAHQAGFYEMSINSAESTNELLDFALRYPTPFHEWIVPATQQAQIDLAWVYGLIRQESRFMTGAKSSVGAQGLMQVMPATAREIANKIGISSQELYQVAGNIRMGTWYLGDNLRRLHHSEVMTTAAYNAGASRAKRWQDQQPLEGAIYAETIPFTETRDYVKKVMTNAVYYAALLNTGKVSLKQRMGVIPAKP